MTKYVIYKNEGTTNKKFIQTIYRNTTCESSDMGDALELPNKELALGLCDYLNDRNSEKYKVMCIKTTIEEVVE